MNVISTFEHNRITILLFGSGPGDIAKELGELIYHIDVMYVCDFIPFILFLSFFILVDKY